MEVSLKLSELVINSINPRKITEFMQDKLTQSILVSPWLLKIRPLVVDEQGKIWSGNARCASLRAISSMDEETVEDFMSQQTIYRNLSEEDKGKLLTYWKKWQESPEVPCRRLEGFTEDEKKELLVKDNMHAGEDDAEILRKFFDRDLISDFFGSVSWDLYDYSDKINDEGLEKNKVNLKTFKCGYVELFLTEAELEGLEKLLAAYKDENGGNADGFLSYLLGDEELNRGIIGTLQELKSASGGRSEGKEGEA